MRITFVFYECNNLGIEYLSSYLKQKGHKVSLAFDPALFKSFTINQASLARIFDYKACVVDQIIESEPDLVGFAVVSDTYGWALEIAREVKNKLNVPIIFGGIHPTSVPEVVISENCVDYVCVGEGEDAVNELLDAIKTKKDTKAIKNIWSKKDGKVMRNSVRSLIDDLDQFPFPDKQLFYDKYQGFKSSYNIITSRGCPYRCSFCYNSSIIKTYGSGYLRQRSVDNVIAELLHAKSQYGIERIFFVDDTLCFNQKWFEEFCTKYKEQIALPFTCEIYPTVNGKTVSLLEDAGCVAVNIGIQTISEDLRKNVLQRNESNKQIETTLRLFNKTNIYTYVDIILGIPGQDEAELIAIIQFLQRYRPDYVLVNWLRLYPGTEIINFMRSNKYITEDRVKEIEECIDYIPFTHSGNTFNTEIGKLGNLIFISRLLPKALIDFLISKKMYKKLNSSTYLPLRLYAIIVSIYTAIFSPKKRLLYFTPTWQIKYYWYWIMKKIKS